jgi:3-oxoacyl-[acyl-carrier-protein] synthase-1
MMKYYVNCLGINNAVGGNAKEVYQAIFTDQKVSSDEFHLASGLTTVVKKVQLNLPQLPTPFIEFESRNNRLLLHAVEQIRPQIDYFIQKYGRRRVAIVLGTSTSGVQETETAFIKRAKDPSDGQFQLSKQEISNPSDFLAAYLDLRGLHYTVSTACTSSGKAFIEAKRLLEAGFCEAVIVGGVDTLSSLTLDGFDSLESVSPKVSNPFSANRDGINIGEGAAVFILSKEESEIEFLSYGESSDAYHISSPDPEGVGAEIALRAALEKAKLSPSDIGYINLHGTATRKNDFMEGHLVQRIFGSQTPVSSTKPFIGHTLGAAAAQEAALCWLALSPMNVSKNLPLHVWDGEKDPELPELHFVKMDDKMRGSYCMSNSFAFGGNNVSLIFARSAS